MKKEQDAMIGRTISHYRILSLLGQGGIGKVYLGWDERLGRNVALKFLPAELTRDQERIQRFKQEARAASALNHPNIITLFEIDEADGAYFIATEFIDGQTLRQCLADGAMSLPQTLDIGVQVASALNEAHGAGIVHRDIKPENIMLRRDGYVKVLDFGLAKLSESVRASDSLRQFLTDPGKVMGTPRYMSPEQIRGMQVDNRTDIFSLGVVLYEMIAGRGPFDCASAGETIAAILEREPAPLHAPPELAQIVSKALAKNRDVRWPHISELLSALKQLKLDLEFPPGSNAKTKHKSG